MEYDITIQKQNNSYVQIHCDECMNHKIYCLFSAFQPGYRFNPRYKLKLWDGKIHCYSPITQLLPIGLVDNLLNWCKKNNYTYKLFGLDDFKDTINFADMKNEINSQITKFDARDYQLSAIYQALTNKRGVLLSCTGSGKSLMIYGILKYLINRKNKRHLLLIVPSVSLVEQMYSDFIDYGWKNIENDVEKLYSGMDPTFKTPVLISTWQSLENQDKDFFADFQGVIVDECHGTKANVVSRLLKQCLGADYKIGTTGTLPTETADQLMINGVLGNVIYELKSKQLIELGYLTKIVVASIFVKYPQEFIMANKDRTYQEEVKVVEEKPERNRTLNFVIDHSKPTDNILILVNHKEHLKSVKEYLNLVYPDRKVSIIMGEVKAKERESIRTGIEDEDGTLLLATYGTVSTGINIPKLHAVMLYANSKSRIKVLQSIGRGLRKHVSKNKVIIYDIIDDLSYKTRTGKAHKNYCMQHYDERLSYYTEQEFPVVETAINI